jgi:hypothetical protein
MVRTLFSILLIVVIAFNSICFPAYASTEDELQEGGIGSWIGSAIVGAVATEVVRITVCALIVPEFPPAAIPCGAALAVDTAGVAAGVTTSKALQQTSKTLIPAH